MKKLIILFLLSISFGTIGQKSPRKTLLKDINNNTTWEIPLFNNDISEFNTFIDGRFSSKQIINDSLVNIRNSIDTKSSVNYTNQKLHFVNTKTELLNLDINIISKVRFDNSDWYLKNGNVASNGGSYAGTIVNINSNYYWERQLKENTIEGVYFGIVANGTTDDLVNTRNAFASLTSGKTLKLPNGIIYFSGSNNILTDGLNITQSNVIIKGSGNTTIKQDGSSFYCLSINGNNGGTSDVTQNISNIKIQDINFLGTVATTGFSEFRHNLNVHAVTDLIIDNCTFTGFRGDGILIGSGNQASIERHNKNIRITNCKFDGVNNDNRNGISVIDCDGLEISSCIFKNTTKSTMPGAIDIEPDVATYHYINNISIHHNIFENISGNLGVISYLGNSTMVNQINSLNISDNEIKNYIGTGAGISVITGFTHSNTSLANNVKINKNTIINGDVPLAISGVKLGIINNNTFASCKHQIQLGSSIASADNYQLIFNNNTITKVGLTGNSGGLYVFTCKDLQLENNFFIDNYGFAVDFTLGTSNNVNIKNNTFLNFSGNTTQAVFKEANHTTSSATNTVFNNTNNGLGIYFPSYKTDIDQTTNVYDLTVLPSVFPIGQSRTIVNGISGLPDSYTQGILITDRNTITAGYTGWITQSFYPRSSATYYYIRKSAGSDNSWTTWNKFSDIVILDKKLQTVTTIAELQAYTLSNYAYLDGSLWEKKSGNVASNGGSFAGTIINVNSNFYWERKIDNEINTKLFGTIADGTTNNTSKVQLAVNSVNSNGGTVFVPENTKFYLSSITFPRKCVLKYYGGSDLSLKLVAISSNELITHIADADNSDGIVNEQRIEANFHPGIVVNVRKDINNHPFLGNGQSLNFPVRASYLIQDEGYEKFIIQHQNFGEKSLYNGIYSYNFFHIIELINIKNSSFTTLPIVGNLITGNTSGAKGIVTAIDTTKITVNWITKGFTIGETVTCNRGTISSPINEVSNTTITAINIDVKNGNPLTFSNDNGYTGIGVLPNIAKSPLTVGGRIAIQKSRSFGQYLPETITNPSLAFVDSYENTTPDGYEIYYNTVPTNKRLELKKLNSNTAFGEVGAVKAHTSFGNDVNFSYTSYNILSVVRASTGQYNINFKVPFTRADFQISLTNGSPLDTSCRYAQDGNTLTIRNFATGTTTLQDLLAPVDIIIVGGDY